MKKILIYIIFSLLIASQAGAQGNSVRLSAFFPEPVASFEDIRLIPNDTITPVGSCKVGNLFLKKPLTSSSNAEIYSCYFNGTSTDTNAGIWSLLRGVWSEDQNENIYPSHLNLDAADDPFSEVKVGIGTATPEFGLTLKNDGGILALDTCDTIGCVGDTLTTTGAGSRFIWHPKKTALRAGALDTNNPNQWDENNIGTFSSAFGMNNLSSGNSSAALGGYKNQTSSNFSTIAGGYENTVSTSTHTTIAGGHLNSISSSISGHNTIIGGKRNTIKDASYSVIAGGGDKANVSPAPANRIEKDYGVIGGGTSNSITDSSYSTIVSGKNNTISSSSGSYNSILSGEDNKIQNTAIAVSIISGKDHDLSGKYILTGGGLNNDINTDTDGTPSEYSGILGGQDNVISADYSSIGGGLSNENSCAFSTIIGGKNNGTSSKYAFVGGGEDNVAHGASCSDTNVAIMGGQLNKCLSSKYCTIGGGSNNTITSNLDRSYIPGGQSIKIGRNAKYVWAGGKNITIGQGAEYLFVWGHHDTGITIPDNTKYRFLILTGNVGIQTLAPEVKLHVNGTTRAQGLYVTNMRPKSGALEKQLMADANGNFSFFSPPSTPPPPELDIAESFSTDEPVEAGDVLSMVSDDKSGALEKSRAPYDQKVIGIVSTSPAVVFEGAETRMMPKALGPEEQTTTPPIALKGRVPVKVTLENGPIEPGDPLTSSSTPGHAMKSTDPERSWGTTIGKALEGFSGGPDGEMEGVIITFVTLY